MQQSEQISRIQELGIALESARTETDQARKQLAAADAQAATVSQHTRHELAAKMGEIAALGREVAELKEEAKVLRERLEEALVAAQNAGMYKTSVLCKSASVHTVSITLKEVTENSFNILDVCALFGGALVAIA
jgi:predicted RNase H-like nuclease (RuvC/YqgF family)